AANSIWGKSLREYFCVDISADMNDLAAVLLRDGKQDGRPCMKGVFFRQFLPVSPMNKFDVIISSYSLMDLPSVQERINTLRTLWIKTEHFLVVIENGTNEGYKTVLEARDLILHGENYLKTNRRIRKLDAEQDEDELNKESEQYSSNVDMKREFDKAVSMSMKMNDNWPVGHVYSPCSHDLPCPRLNDGTDTPCNYLQEYHPLKLSQMPKQVQKENFSYVVLRKGQRSKGCNEWPRLIRPVLVKSKHIHCHMCCHDGRIHHTVLTASKHGKDLYYCARYSKWGDQLPLSILAETMNKSTQENDSTQHKQCTEPTTEEDW
ncbi:ribosome assembly protein METTL17, mitochondrial-like, partial [Saccoglossus kowalevskii]|uniref:Methyltransferase-like protein 17, mitochondrial-like n=1 Tax=Saccoglossus kowalevskii TaxID=10224 RepID=A0ABM0MMG0_SACKO